MQLFAGIADATDQLRFHEAVDVLALGVKGQRPGRKLLPNGREPGDNLLPLGIRENPLPGQHRHMGNAALNILRIKPPVKRQGSVKSVYIRVGFFGKASAP